MCFSDQIFQEGVLCPLNMMRVIEPSDLSALKQFINAILQAYSNMLNDLFEAAVIGGSVEFERYSMVEDLVDALAEVQRCFTVLEPAEEVEL